MAMYIELTDERGRTSRVDAGLRRIQVRRVECGVLKPLDLVRHVLLFVGGNMAYEK
jgi:hypothetical protein